MNDHDLLPRIDRDAGPAYDPHLLRMLELERAARVLDVEARIVEQMRHADLETTFHMPSARSDGTAGTVSALQCLYSQSFPCIAEFAIGPEIFLNQIRASGFSNDLACALLGIDARGGAAGIICDLSQFSEREVRRLIHRYCESLRATVNHPVCFSRISGANGSIHGWLNNNLRTWGSGLRVPAARLADTQSRRLAHWIKELISFSARQRPQTFAIQDGNGLGTAIAQAVTHSAAANTDAAAAGSAACSAGKARCSGGTETAKVVMMSDSSGALRNEDGLDLGQLQEYVARDQVSFGFPGAEHAYSAELLACECDCLILQAPMQITAANAGAVAAKMIVECVPDAISHEAKSELAARKVTVLPDILVRSGLILVAASDCSPVPLSDRRIRGLLHRCASTLSSEIRDSALEWGVDFAAAAVMLAIDRRAGEIRREEV